MHILRFYFVGQYAQSGGILWCNNTKYEHNEITMADLMTLNIATRKLMLFVIKLIKYDAKLQQIGAFLLWGRHKEAQLLFWCYRVNLIL